MTEQEFWEIVDGALVNPATPFFLEDHYLSYWNAVNALSDQKMSEFATMHETLVARAIESGLEHVVVLVQKDFDMANLEAFASGLISRGQQVYYNCLTDPQTTLLSITRPLLLSKCAAFQFVPAMIRAERQGAEGPPGL